MGDIFATGISTFSEGFAGDVLIDDKIVHRGDTDTAIRFPSANTVSVETGGRLKEFALTHLEDF